MTGIVVATLVGTLALFCVEVSGKIDWCDLKCGDVENTMCRYEEKTSTDNCQSIENSMTPERRVDLLKQHNEFRNNLAGGKLDPWPTAADMRLLTWDDDLEKPAQRWASQCIVGHDRCRRTPKHESVGQNLLWSGSTVQGDSAVPITGWTKKEMDLASPDELGNYRFDRRTGHFTQVVWGNTFKLGCGETTYEKRGRYWVTLACNYGPAGNVIDSPIYTQGEPCSGCPDGTQCFSESEYPYLCATQEEIDSLSK